MLNIVQAVLYLQANFKVDRVATYTYRPNFAKQLVNKHGNYNIGANKKQQSECTFK